MDEISAKKFKRGQVKIKLAGRICGRILPKVAEKGPENMFSRRSLLNGTDTLLETKENFNFISY
jgi:hypothetical protein